MDRRILRTSTAMVTPKDRRGERESDNDDHHVTIRMISCIFMYMDGYALWLCYIVIVTR